MKRLCDGGEESACIDVVGAWLIKEPKQKGAAYSQLKHVVSVAQSVSAFGC